MNDIISVVTISLMPKRAFSQAGMIVQAAPIAMAISASTIQPTTTGTWVISHGPMPATKAAASRYCPSMPRFHRLARKTTMRPHAMRRSGAMRSMESYRPDARPTLAVTMSR